MSATVGMVGKRCNLYPSITNANQGPASISSTNNHHHQQHQQPLVSNRDRYCLVQKV
jgi:ATP adenylyltransferase/5',5'''-P-1,P-4-tetraphosphate phosphorylase II